MLNYADDDDAGEIKDVTVWKCLHTTTRKRINEKYIHNYITFKNTQYVKREVPLAER